MVGPDILGQGGGCLFAFMSKTVRMLVVPGLKCEFCATCVLSFGVVMCYGGFINDTFSTAFVIHRALVLIPTVAGFLAFCCCCCFVPQNFFIVLLHDSAYVISATVT